MGATRTVIPATRTGALGAGEEARLLVVEYLDGPPALEAGDRVAPETVPCVRGWASGGWSVAIPVDVLVRDLGLSRGARMRNGVFLVRGRQLGPWFVVDAVLRRQSIVAPDGAVLVSSWPSGATAPARRWVPADAPPRPWPEPDSGEDVEEPAVIRKRRRARRAAP